MQLPAVTAFDVHPQANGLFAVGRRDGWVELQFHSSSSNSGGGDTLTLRHQVKNTSQEIRRLRFAAEDRFVRILCASGQSAYVFESHEYDPTSSPTSPLPPPSMSFTTKKFSGQHQLELCDCHFSFDGKLVVTVGLDNQVVVWDATTQKPQRQLPPGSPQMCRAVAMDPLGRYCVGVTKDAFQVWRVDEGRIATVSQKLTNQPASSQLTCVDWSPDGQYLVVGTSMGSVFGYRRDTWDLSEMSFPGQGGEAVLAVRFSPVLYGSKHRTMFALASRSWITVYADFQSSAVGVLAVRLKPALDLAWLSSGTTVYCLSASATEDEPVNQLTSMHVDLPPGIAALSRADTVKVIESKGGVRRTGNDFVETVEQLDAIEEVVDSPPPSPPPPPPPPPQQAAPVVQLPPPPQQQKETVTKTGKKRIQPALVVKPTTSSDQAATAATSVPMEEVSTTTTTTTTTEDVQCGACKNCLENKVASSKSKGVARCLGRPPPPKQQQQMAPPPPTAQQLLQMPVDEEEDGGTGDGGAAATANDGDGDDGWESSDLELDADNSAGYVLTAGTDQDDDEYALPYNQQQQPVEYMIGARLTLSVQSTPAFASVLTLTSTNTTTTTSNSKRVWQVVLRSRVVKLAVVRDRFLAVATQAHDVHVFDVPSGAQLGPALSLVSQVVFLDLVVTEEKQQLLLVVGTREGKAWVCDYSNNNNTNVLFANVTLDPLLHMRGRPFSVVSSSSTTTGAALSSSSVRLMVSRSRHALLLLAADGCCYALSSSSASSSWTKLLDPLRYVGSELLALRPTTTSSTSSWEIDHVHRQLGLLHVTSAAQQANLLFQQEVSLAATVAQLEAHVLAAQHLRCSAEEQRHWAKMLFARLAKDFALLHGKARFWLGRLEKDNLLLQVLQANADYQALCEEWRQRALDLG